MKQAMETVEAVGMNRKLPVSEGDGPHAGGVMNQFST
jgi:hypothetical protein